MHRALLALVVVLLVAGGAPAQDPVAMVGPIESTKSRLLALRLRPGQDLRKELMRVVEQEKLEAAAIVTCVGSLTKVTLRYANQPEGTVIEGHHLEIVSLVGTLGRAGSHLHLSVSDETGKTVGGHLLEGSAVYTTAEIVLQVLDDVRFGRAHDDLSTYDELVFERR